MLIEHYLEVAIVQEQLHQKIEEHHYLQDMMVIDHKHDI